MGIKYLATNIWASNEKHPEKGPTIRSLTWGGGNKFMAINCVRQVFVLTEQELAVDYYGGVSAVQACAYFSTYKNNCPLKPDHRIVLSIC